MEFGFMGLEEGHLIISIGRIKLVLFTKIACQPIFTGWVAVKWNLALIQGHQSTFVLHRSKITGGGNRLLKKKILNNKLLKKFC